MTSKERTCGCCRERPATCFGAYEAQEHWDYACDVCCGHGCEDGQCYPVQTAEEARAELEAEGVDVDGFLERLAFKLAEIGVKLR